MITRYNKLKLVKIMLIFILVLVCFYYICNPFSYSKYRANVKSEVDTKVASWSILLNKENITDTFEKKISISDINWNAEHTESKYVAPGSNGNFTLEIDVDSTEVAFKYDISYTDKSVDNNYVLTISSITSSDGFLVNTDENNYTGLFSLSDIEKKRKKIITVNVYWPNDDDTNFDSEVSDDSNYLDLKFTATQYHGESIVEYSK